MDVQYDIRGLRNVKVNSTPVAEERYVTYFKGSNTFIDANLEVLTLVRTDNGVKTEVRRLNGN